MWAKWNVQKFDLFLEIYCDSFWEGIVDFVMLSIKYFINSIFFLLQRFFVVEDIIPSHNQGVGDKVCTVKTS